MRAQSSTVQQCRKEVSETKAGYVSQRKKILEQEKKIVQQGQTITELEKKVNDLNQKFIDMSAEMLKLKEVNEKGDAPSTSHKCLLGGDLKGDDCKGVLKLDNSEVEGLLKSPKTRGQKRRAKGGGKTSAKRSKC